MFGINENIWRKLYRYQRKSIDMINRYIESSSCGDALVKFPTGAGKTFVMGVVCREMFKNRSVLIVTSSKALRYQLEKQISTGLWNKFNLQVKNKNKEVILPTKNSITNDPTDYFVTIQALCQLEKENPPLFKELSNIVDLIIFDEGHRAPALTWQNTLNKIDKKTIIFTATPVRNDQRLFTFDENYCSVLTHQEALELKIIKEVEFKILETQDDPEEFVKELIICQEQFQRDDKCIIRCENKDQIVDIVGTLARERKLVKGIHDTFVNEGNYYNDVPKDWEEENAQYWVHQFKLLEGIDDNSFNVLAVFGSIKSSRSLVQQIGRIIRNNGGKPALVISSSERVEEMWNQYLEAEKEYFRTKDMSILVSDRLLNSEEYVEAILENVPQYQYINNIYSKRFCVENERELEQKRKKYQLKLKTNAYYVVKQEPIEFLMEKLLNEMKVINIHILDFFVDTENNSCVIVYLHFNNSELLSSEHLLEHTLALEVVKILDSNLFYYDTESRVSYYIENNYQKVKANKLNRIFSNDSTFNNVTLKNSSVARNSFHTMSIVAENMENLSKDLNNKFRTLTTVIARNSDKANVYVGYSKARLTKGNKRHSLEEYYAWLNNVHEKIIGDTEEANFFSRYSISVDTPENTGLKYICIDFPVYNAVLVNDKNEDIPLEGMNIKIDYEIDLNGEFTFELLGFNFDICIIFDERKQRYYFETTNTCDFEIKVENTTFIEWLNWSQSFQGILEDNQYRYLNGSFYRIGVMGNELLRSDIFDEVKFLNVTGKINEKGQFYRKEDRRQHIKNQWDENSLFYAISTKGKELGDCKIKEILSEAEVIVCTDLNSEIADFITISKKKKEVCFIHCKASKNSKLSASAFQEVCSQINKSIDYVYDYYNKLPNDTDKWEGQWSNVGYQVCLERFIENSLNIAKSDFWAVLKEIQKDVESRTYVIAFVGDTFSLENYREEKKKCLSSQKPEVIQIDYLLNTTNFNVVNANAIFLISYNDTRLT